MPADVSNLGRDPSVRFAKDQQRYDPSIQKDAGKIPGRTKVTVLAPSPNWLEQFLNEAHTTKPQASFSAPSCYEGYNRPAFLGQLTPATAPASSWDSRSEKMTGVLDSLPEDNPAKEPLTRFVKLVNEFERDMASTRAEMNRYHQG